MKGHCVVIASFIVDCCVNRSRYRTASLYLLSTVLVSACKRRAGCAGQEGQARELPRTVRVRNCVDLISNSKLEGILTHCRPLVPVRVRPFAVGLPALPPGARSLLKSGCNVGLTLPPAPSLRAFVQDSRPPPASASQTSRAFPDKA